MTEPVKYFESLPSAFMAHFARRLADLIIEQSTELLKESGITTPTTSISTMLLLEKEAPLTVTDIANSMGVSHQISVQRIANLEKIGLVERFQDPKDKRSRLIRLSHEGKKEAPKLEKHIANGTLALKQLENELGLNLSQKIREAELALREKSIKTRQEELGLKNPS